MKLSIFVISLTILSIVSCTSDNSTIKDFTPKLSTYYYKNPPPPNYDFQKTNCMVFFGNTSEEIESSRKFLIKNGLSLSMYWPARN